MGLDVDGTRNDGDHDGGDDPVNQLLLFVWAISLWNILIGFPEVLYWNFLDPDVLGMNLTAIFTFVGGVASWVALDWPAVRNLLGQHPWTVALAPPVFLAASAFPNTKVRSA